MDRLLDSVARLARLARRDVGLPGTLRITAGTPAETSAVLEAMAALGAE